MSLQFGVSDILLISKLAWQVHQTFKYAPKELQSLDQQVLTISNLLHQIEDTFEELRLNRKQRRTLRQLMTQSEEALKDVHVIVQRFTSVVNEKAKWKILRYYIDSGNIQQVKQQLIDQVGLLTNFNTTIAIWSLAGIKGKLDRFVATAPDDSIASGKDMNTLHDDDDSWSQLHRELEDIGIASEVIVRNRQYFVAWIAAAISKNEPPDKRLDKLWDSPIESEPQLCALCGHDDHYSEACPQMDTFGEKQATMTHTPSIDSYSLRSSTVTATSISGGRRKLSLASFGTDPNISAGFGPGYGPQVPLYRPRPSSVSTGSSSSRASRKLSHDSSDTTDAPLGERPSLRNRLHNRFSAFGSSSPSAEQGF